MAWGRIQGLKRINTGIDGENYQDLIYVRRRYIHKEQLRSAIAKIVNATFEIRLPHIWGEGTTTCASDSKHFGAWEQNLITQYHLRYGGRGVMIYWHVEKNSTCIYSQLKTCSSSEVSAMINGVLKHCTSMEVKKNYVDSHGQSEVAFAFTHLLGFQLMPRLKRIKVQKLYRPHAGQPDAYYDSELVTANGQIGIIYSLKGNIQSLATFEFIGNRIRSIYFVRNPDKLKRISDIFPSVLLE